MQAQTEQLVSDAYRLLAASFCDPERDTLLEENVPGQLESTLQAICPTAAEVSSQLARWLQEATQQELQVEYARLFVGPHSLLAPPYGSVYLDGDHSVMGPSTVQVGRLYQEAGLELDPDGSEPPDHVAIELEFAHFVTSEEARRREEGDDRGATKLSALRRLFLTRYLLPWAPSFCEDVQRHTESPYFAALAGTLKSFLHDCEASRLESDA